MNPEETRQHLRWLMILRVVTVTTLLISAAAIELLARPERSLRPLFLLAAVAYGMVLVYAALDRWLKGTVSFLILQLLGDTLVVTGFVGITGGLDSPMSFLYLLPIAVASMALFRRGALALAGVSWAMYASLVLSGEAWLPLGSLVPVGPVREPGRTGYFLVVHLVAFVLMALLASSLSERLRTQGRELAERSGAVARLQALNANIIESINSGLVTTDLSGLIQFLNRGGAEITGFRPEEIRGRSVEERFGFEAGFLQEARRVLLARRRFRFERPFRTPDGRAIYLGFAVSTLQERSGAPLGYIFIFQDLTEIQALEQEVRLKERMAALGEMAAGMAHELRNPLASMSGAVQYLKGALEPRGETLELMDIILRESQRLDQAIRDFLTFARPGRFEPQRIELVRLLEDHLKLLRKSREFGPRHHIATRYSHPEIWCDVDPNRVKQVLWNLNNNALKSMADGGTLRIAVVLQADGGTVEIEVSDEGTGMTEHEVACYFQPFHSSFREGTGLGAAIVYRLVEEHGGRIGLESAPGRGTRVQIVLPRFSPRSEVAEIEEATPLRVALGDGR